MLGYDPDAETTAQFVTEKFDTESYEQNPLTVVTMPTLGDACADTETGEQTMKGEDDGT